MTTSHKLSKLAVFVFTHPLAVDPAKTADIAKQHGMVHLTPKVILGDELLGQRQFIQRIKLKLFKGGYDAALVNQKFGALLDNCLDSTEEITELIPWLKDHGFKVICFYVDHTGPTKVTLDQSKAIERFMINSRRIKDMLIKLDVLEDIDESFQPVVNSFRDFKSSPTDTVVKSVEMTQMPVAVAS
jgi:hypothetical protein